ncbi:MAG: hypothetical protein CL398_11420 [Acidiferrobacteraceae bacterium]|nr:hypothetical protein [Acidiferrobacteraceae bacterium]|tara:strand:- start:1670 stop:2362 length:693 start_codon:yes stop_codon:yes gene_type:complete
MKIEPVSIEIVLDSGIVLRGYEWPARGAPVVMLHDYGEDLDAWHGLDQKLAEGSFRVINVELRGHGFSDGEPDSETLQIDAPALLREVQTVWGPVAVCTYGSVAGILCSMGEQYSPLVHIAISPVLPSTVPVSSAVSSKNTAYLMISSTGDDNHTSQARRIFENLGPSKLWASVASTNHGPELIQNHAHLIGDMTIFLQRYLVPSHVKWQDNALREAITDEEREQLEVKK